MFAYSDAIATGQQLETAKAKSARISEKDEDIAIADYSEKLADKEKGGGSDEDVSLKLSEHLLSQSADSDPLDDDEQKPVLSSSKIEFWSKQDPDGQVKLKQQADKKKQKHEAALNKQMSQLSDKEQAQLKHQAL